MNQAYYCVKSRLIPGKKYPVVLKVAKRIFAGIKRGTKRRPYIRSKYFNHEKVFFEYFWNHLNQKSTGDQRRRLQYFDATIELIQNSKKEPKIIFNNKNEIIYRFQGFVESRLFFVQIKEDLKRKQKYLLSIFD